MRKALLLAGAALLGFGGAAVAQQMPPDTGVPTEEAPPNASGMDSTAPQTPTDPGMPADAGAGAQAPTDAGTAAQTPTDAGTAAQAPAGAADPAASGMAATPSAGAADPARMAAAQQTVQSGWATYDPENKGSLTPLEFGKWVMAAQGNDMSAQVDKTRTSKARNLPAIKVLNATSTAFSKADTNRDRVISRDELTAFLSA